ncbi:MAG: hypothetical protein KBB55_02945 [Candidatus Buchananbacteria bacterium]|nr:hypothetical protein [Candidatus Buchananbacteria bacterium]
MTYYQYVQSIEDELEALNRIIDWKILQRQPYTSESKRHQDLLGELRRSPVPKKQYLHHVLSFMF